MSLSHSAWLADGVHFAWAGADIVTLDLRTDAYGLMTDAAALVRPGPGRELVANDVTILTALVEARLASASRPSETATLTVPKPETALLPGTAGDCAIAPRMAAAIGALIATARFHRSSLSALLQSGPPPSRPRALPVRLEDAHAAFDAVLPWIPFEGQCLQRAYMLRRHLVRCGHPARWVIGVRTWPFLAHAWVQVGPRVIGDSLERVETFTPILVV
jgi:hypothetical protein